MKMKKIINDDRLEAMFRSAKPTGTVPPLKDEAILSMIRSRTVKTGVRRIPIFGKPVRAVAAAAAVCLICVSVLLVGNMSRDDSGGITVNGRGDFFISRDGVKLGKSAMAFLRRGDVLSTGCDGILRLTYSGGIIVLAHSSSLRIDDIALNGAVLFLASLNNGSVAVQSDKMQKGSSMRIRTRDADVAVRGTKFLVSADESTGTKIIVNEGKVLLNSDNHSPLVVDSRSKVTVSGQRLLRSVKSAADSYAMDALLNEKTGDDLRARVEKADDDRTVKKYCYTLSPEKMWEKTGIMINEGDIVSVSAEGMVNLWPNYVGPKTADGADVIGYDSTRICPNIKFGMLLLRIDGRIYPVGSHDVFSATHAGEIEVVINDTYGGFSDNAGSLNISFVIREEKK